MKIADIQFTTNVFINQSIQYCTRLNKRFVRSFTSCLVSLLIDVSTIIWRTVYILYDAAIFNLLILALIFTSLPVLLWLTLFNIMDILSDRLLTHTSNLPRLDIDMVYN